MAEPENPNLPVKEVTSYPPDQGMRCAFPVDGLQPFPKKRVPEEGIPEEEIPEEEIPEKTTWERFFKYGLKFPGGWTTDEQWKEFVVFHYFQALKMWTAHFEEAWKKADPREEEPDDSALKRILNTFELPQTPTGNNGQPKYKTWEKMAKDGNTPVHLCHQDDWMTFMLDRFMHVNSSVCQVYTDMRTKEDRDEPVPPANVEESVGRRQEELVQPDSLADDIGTEHNLPQQALESYYKNETGAFLNQKGTRFLLPGMAHAIYDLVNPLNQVIHMDEPQHTEVAKVSAVVACQKFGIFASTRSSKSHEDIFENDPKKQKQADKYPTAYLHALRHLKMNTRRKIRPADKQLVKLALEFQDEDGMLFEYNKWDYDVVELKPLAVEILKELGLATDVSHRDGYLRARVAAQQHESRDPEFVSCNNKALFTGMQITDPTRIMQEANHIAEGWYSASNKSRALLPCQLPRGHGTLKADGKAGFKQEFKQVTLPNAPHLKLYGFNVHKYSVPTYFPKTRKNDPDFYNMALPKMHGQLYDFQLRTSVPPEDRDAQQPAADAE